MYLPLKYSSCILTLASLTWFAVGANSAVKVPFLFEIWGKSVSLDPSSMWSS